MGHEGHFFAAAAEAMRRVLVQEDRPAGWVSFRLPSPALNEPQQIRGPRFRLAHLELRHPRGTARRRHDLEIRVGLGERAEAPPGGTSAHPIPLRYRRFG